MALFVRRGTQLSTCWCMILPRELFRIASVELVKVLAFSQGCAARSLKEKSQMLWAGDCTSGGPYRGMSNRQRVESLS